MIDLDPQSNATLELLGDEGWAAVDRARATIADVFEAVSTGKNPPDVIRSQAPLGGGRVFDLLPGSPRLQEVEEALSDSPANWRYRPVGPYLLLRTYAAILGLKQRYDTVLIDCSTSIGAATINGLCLADGFLLPVMPTPVSMTGVTQIVARLREHESSSGLPLKHYGAIVNTPAGEAGSARTVLEQMRSTPDLQPLWKTVIPRADAGSARWRPDLQARTLLQRWGAGAKTPFCAAMEQLSVEFLRRIG